MGIQILQTSQAKTSKKLENGFKNSCVIFLPHLRRKWKEKNCRIFGLLLFCFSQTKSTTKGKIVFPKKCPLKCFSKTKTKKNMFAPTNWKQSNWKVGLIFDAVSLCEKNLWIIKTKTKQIKNQVLKLRVFFFLENKKKKEKTVEYSGFPFVFFPQTKSTTKTKLLFKKMCSSKCFESKTKKHVFAPTNWKQANWKVGFIFDAVSLSEKKLWSIKTKTKQIKNLVLKLCVFSFSLISEENEKKKRKNCRIFWLLPFFFSFKQSLQQNAKCLFEKSAQNKKTYVCPNDSKRGKSKSWLNFWRNFLSFNKNKNFSTKRLSWMLKLL